MFVQKFNFQGDEYEVVWTGSVWVSPCNGQHHSKMWDAIQTECEDSAAASGDYDADCDYTDQVELVGEGEEA